MPGIKKILVIRLSSLGDIILSFPLLRKIKEKFPDSDVHFLTKKKYAEILSLNRDIDEILLFEDTQSDTKKRIYAEKYDLILDIHNNLRTSLMKFLPGVKVKKVKKESFKKFLLVKFKINLFKNITPVYKKYLLLIKDYLNERDFDFTTTDLQFDRTKSLENDYIVVAPSSKHFTKTYPKEKFVEYISRINKGKKVVLVGDDSERDVSICSYIESKCSNVVNMCGKLDMKQLANILYNSEFVVTNDSAILHFAEAVGKNVIAIFGSTVKEFGFFPQLTDSIVYEVNGLKCRPCTHIGRDSCPLGHFKCMSFSITNYEIITNC